LDAQPLKIDSMAIPREANDKFERSRILFVKVSPKTPSALVTGVFVIEFLLHDIPEAFILGVKYGLEGDIPWI
jgi:hypothetical protein